MFGTLRFDGGARPTNPGHAGFAVIIETVSNRYELSRYIGKKTNNYAEYCGLIVGVKYAYYVGVREIEIISDSKLVVCQVNGDWHAKDFTIRSLCRQAQEALAEFFPDQWSLKWEKRVNNEDADNLCTDAIYYGMNRNPFTPSSIRDKRPEGRIIDPFRLFPPTPVVPLA